LNSLDLFNLIDACLNPDGRFLYVSSSDVYRGNNDLPNRETQLGLSDPWSARSCYTESKRFGETLCAAFLASGRIVRVARLALGYGAGNRHDDKRVMYEFIRQALKFRKIEMADEGSALRTYISMCDVSRMMLNIMFCGKFPVYNVGGVSRLSILELASLISDLTNSDLVVGEGKSTSAVLRAAPADVWLDVSRYLDEFPGSFESLKEGLSKVILWNTHQS
jgi:nucleoside-diphosphate-sugar epimerase